MFWKKKTVYETRPVYSIRQELERLRPFVCPRQSEGTGTYTEEDIQAAEERLGYQLPVPVRELYLVMGDIMCRQDVPDVREYFLPLDQLHWDGRYLLLYAGTSTNYGYGIDRKDPYVDVFQWKRVGLTPEGRPLPDTGKPSRSEVVPKSASRWGYTKLVYWDKFVYQKVLDIVYDGWFFRRNITDELDPFFVSCILPKPVPALRELRETLAKYFAPLCQHPELNQVQLFRATDPKDSLVYGWSRESPNCLLLLTGTAQHYGLITSEPAPYSFTEEVERQTGLVFYAANQTGLDRVRAHEAEMKQAGLLR